MLYVTDDTQTYSRYLSDYSDCKDCIYCGYAAFGKQSFDMCFLEYEEQGDIDIQIIKNSREICSEFKTRD